MTHHTPFCYTHFRILLLIISFVCLKPVSLKRVPDRCYRFPDNGVGNVPARNALIVRQSSTKISEFRTISDAVKALQKLSGPQQIFIYPGTYKEQMIADYEHPLLIQGFSPSTRSFVRNTVFITEARSLGSTGSDSKSSVLWAKSSCFEMRNVNVINSFGSGSDTQAVALTAEGEQQVFKACVFSSYQDTLYIKATRAYFNKCLIQGTVDFICGPGTAWFEKAQIAVKKPLHSSTITAQKSGSTVQTRFVFNKCRILGLNGTPPHTTYLGRPWSSYAAVTYQFCDFSNIIHPEGWSAWKTDRPNTEHIQFEEFSNTGLGAGRRRRFGRMLNQPRTIESVLGAEFILWAV
ncbi:hypothetical protein O181_007022 [Austropuccinia psidii MF-1]|uniref:pectinesterase n=1 Tax=Austropuccinia psidii MF-1 TaxID=1389203 RepID=A0A9Q3GI32_9BASI|nr:hypothetical protein [Austropuccinia psidii MF-1]